MRRTEHQMQVNGSGLRSLLEEAYNAHEIGATLLYWMNETLDKWVLSGLPDVMVALERRENSDKMFEVSVHRNWMADEPFCQVFVKAK